MGGATSLFFFLCVFSHTAPWLFVSVHLEAHFEELPKVQRSLAGSPLGPNFPRWGQWSHVAQLPRWTWVQRPPDLPHVLHGLVWEVFFVSSSPCALWLTGMHLLWSLQALHNLWTFEMWGGIDWGSPLPGDRLWLVGQLKAQTLGVGLFYRVWIHAHASVSVRKPLWVMLHRAESQGIFSRSWLVREFTSWGGRSQGPSFLFGAHC